MQLGIRDSRSFNARPVYSGKDGHSTVAIVGFSNAEIEIHGFNFLAREYRAEVPIDGGHFLGQEVAVVDWVAVCPYFESHEVLARKAELKPGGV